MTGIDAIIVGAVSTLLAITAWRGGRARGGLAGHRHESRGRDPGALGRVRGPPTRIRGLAPWSRQHAETGVEPAHESRAASAGVQGQPAEKPRTYGMGARDQAREFIAWELAELADAYGAGTPGKWNDGGVWREYNRWAKTFNVITIPRSIFLKVLAQQTAHVKRKRELVLDSVGRSIPNPSGRSKLRDTFYTIAPKRAEPRLPGKVPVVRAVPKRDVARSETSRGADRAHDALKVAA